MKETKELISNYKSLIKDHLFNYYSCNVENTIQNINLLFKINNYASGYTYDFLHLVRAIINAYRNNEISRIEFTNQLIDSLFYKENKFYYQLFIYIFDLPILADFPYDQKYLSNLNIPNIRKILQETCMKENNLPTEEKPSKLSKILTKTQSHSIEIAKRTAAKKIAKGATKPIITILKSLKVENQFIFSMLETEQGIAFVGAIIGLLAPVLPISNQKIKKLINTLSDELQIQGGQAVFEPLINMFLGPFMNEFSKIIEPILSQKEIKQLVGVPFSSKKEIGKKKTNSRKHTKIKKENKEIFVKEVLSEN